MQKIIMVAVFLFLGSALFFFPFSTRAADETTVEHLVVNNFHGGGTSVSLHGFDDQAVLYTLPFSFRFYGTDYTTVYVSTNGFLQFGGTFSDAQDCCAMHLSDNRPPRIYGLGQDFLTSGTDEDVYVTATSESVIFRWQVEVITNAVPMNFEIVLYPNGNFELNYGNNPAAPNYFPTVVGISNGAGLQTASVYDGQEDFNNLQTAYWGEQATLSDTSSDVPDRADIDSWKASLSADSTDCPHKLKLILKGKHFGNDTEVYIGSKEASAVDVSSSKKLTAKFCLEKLLQKNVSLEKIVSVKNPHTDSRKANKKIDLAQFIPETKPQVSEEVKHLQDTLVALGYLDRQYVIGIYGPITIEAVKKFQTDNGLEQTGTVGPLTRAKLAEKSQ